jgi:hypothetical protein
MTTITLVPSFGSGAADLGDLSASELYDSLESWTTQNSIHGRGPSPARIAEWTRWEMDR